MESPIPGMEKFKLFLLSKGITVCLLYGSAARGELKTDSDLDFAVSGPDLLGAEQLSEIYSTACSLFHREIDLVDLRAAHGIFLKEILTGSQYILCEDRDFLGKKAIEMMDFQTDLAPGINRMLLERLQRSLA